MSTRQFVLGSRNTTNLELDFVLRLDTLRRGICGRRNWA
jgi:hypothetical protein